MARRRAFSIIVLMLLAAYPAAIRSAGQASEYEQDTALSSNRPQNGPRPGIDTGDCPAGMKPGTGLCGLPARPSRASASERAVALRWLRTMSLPERIAQLIVITSYGEAPSSRSADFRDFVHAIRDLKVGGMIVVNR